MTVQGTDVRGRAGGAGGGRGGGRSGGAGRSGDARGSGDARPTDRGPGAGAARSRSRQPPRDDRNTDGDIRLGVAAFVLLAAGGLGFGRVLERLDWWFVTLLVMGLVITAAILLRRTRLHPVLTWIGVVAAWLVTVTVMFASTTALLGIVPTPTTFMTFAGLRDAGFQAFRDGAAPLETSTGVIFLMAAGGGLVAIVVAWLVLALHRPVLAGIAVVAVYAAPSVAVQFDMNGFVFIAVAVAFLWLLREDVKRRDRLEMPANSRLPGGAGPTAVVSVIAIVAALLTPAVLPGLAARDTAAGARGSGPFVGGINPMISLGQSLRRPQNTTALQYTTTAGSAPYLKVTDLNEFSGAVWGPDNSGYAVGNDVAEFPSPPGLGGDITTDEYTTKITIDALASPWLPVPYPTRSVTGLQGDWRWEGAGLTAMSRDASTNQQTYTTTSLDVQPTAQQMRSAPPVADAAAAAPYLQLPENLPPIILQTALDVTATASTDYDRAIAMQRYFRGNFEYSETAPVEEGFDGSGAAVIATFLEKKTGYCVHFSSAMAVMSRLLGIPARIAIGYLPGNAAADSTATGKQAVYVVTSNQLHAWPELYFEGIGWVPFEPTASRGTATAFADASTAAPGSVDLGAGARPAPTADPSVPADRGTTGTAQAGSSNGLSAAVLPVGIVLGAILVLLVPFLVRRFEREVRIRRGRRGRTPAGAAWAEFLDSAVDLGFPVSTTESPRAFVRRLGSQFEVGGEPIDRLLAAVEAESYAGGPGGGGPGGGGSGGGGSGRGAGRGASGPGGGAPGGGAGRGTGRGAGGPGGGAPGGGTPSAGRPGGVGSGRGTGGSGGGAAGGDTPSAGRPGGVAPSTGRPGGVASVRAGDSASARGVIDGAAQDELEATLRASLGVLRSASTAVERLFATFLPRSLVLRPRDAPVP